MRHNAPYLGGMRRFWFAREDGFEPIPVDGRLATFLDRWRESREFFPNFSGISPEARVNH
jgi:hypothetical protein